MNMILQFSQNREINVSRNMATSNSRNESIAKISCNKKGVVVNFHSITNKEDLIPYI